jgi:hypothetical protein
MMMMVMQTDLWTRIEWLRQQGERLRERQVSGLMLELISCFQVLRLMVVGGWRFVSPFLPCPEHKQKPANDHGVSTPVIVSGHFFLRCRMSKFIQVKSGMEVGFAGLGNAFKLAGNGHAWGA